MNLKPIVKTLQKCSNEDRFAILKHIESNKQMSFSRLKNIVNIGNRNTFAHHLKLLKGCNVILKDPRTGLYVLTDNGNKILKILEDLREKHITDQPEILCINSKDNNHDFIAVCSKCGVKQK